MPLPHALQRAPLPADQDLHPHPARRERDPPNDLSSSKSSNDEHERFRSDGDTHSENPIMELGQSPLTSSDPPALRPKVQLPAAGTADSASHRVYTDRLLRQYFAIDVAEAVREHIDALGDDLAHQRPDTFPLEVFDDTEYDCRLPSEWADPRAIAVGLRARAAVYQPNSYKPSWTPCSVLAYEGDNRYRVSLDEPIEYSQHSQQTKHSEHHQRAASLTSEVPPHASVSDTVACRKKNSQSADSSQTDEIVVPRIGLCFASEDPITFAKRRAQAAKLRADTKRHMRYSIMIESMPTDDVPQLTAEQMNRIIGHVLNTKKLRDCVVNFTEVAKQINIDYASANNITTLHRRLRDVDKDERDLHIVDLEVEKPPSRCLAAPKQALVGIPEHDFMEQFSEFSFNTFLTSPQAIQAVTKVVQENNNLLRSTSLFSFFFTKSLRLEDFEQLQRHQIDQTSIYLGEQWFSTIRNALQSSFRRSGKGWFNLDEERYEIHRNSKLRTFLTMTRFRMEDTLRMLVNESMESFLSAIRYQCDACIDVQSLQSVRTIGAASRASSERRHAPMFLLDVKVDESNENFVYSNSLEQFKSTVQAVFLQAIRSVHSLPDVESLVMNETMWTRQPHITSVNEHEEHVMSAHDEIGSLLVYASNAAAQYISLFSEFEHILRFDVKAYIRRLQGFDIGSLENVEEASLSTLMSEIEKHESELKYLKERIPGHMNVGPFHINNGQAYENLKKKKEHVLDEVKRLIATVPRRVNQTICDRFKELNKMLRQKASSLEEIQKQRDLIASIPHTVGELMEMYEGSLEYIDALDKLQYSLTEEDIALKADAQHWPARIETTAKSVENVLAQDQLRYMQE